MDACPSCNPPFIYLCQTPRPWATRQGESGGGRSSWEAWSVPGVTVRETPLALPSFSAWRRPYWSLDLGAWWPTHCQIQSWPCPPSCMVSTSPLLARTLLRGHRQGLTTGPAPLIWPGAARIRSREKSSCAVGALLDGHDYIQCTESVRGIQAIRCESEGCS
jgi:hypothetical protein